jgi:hypothetical protein
LCLQNGFAGCWLPYGPWLDSHGCVCLPIQKSEAVSFDELSKVGTKLWPSAECLHPIQYLKSAKSELRASSSILQAKLILRVNDSYSSFFSSNLHNSSEELLIIYNFSFWILSSSLVLKRLDFISKHANVRFIIKSYSINIC